jgi:hypothetical protein
MQGVKGRSGEGQGKARGRPGKGQGKARGFQEVQGEGWEKARRPEEL